MRLIERRIGLVFALFLLALAGAGTKAAWLGIVKADTLRDAAATQQKATLTVPARRGSILDRNGEELAVAQPATSVFATPYLVRDPLAAAEKIAPLLDTTAEALLPKLTTKKTGFVWLARKIPTKQAAKIRDLGIAGIDIQDEARRIYPHDWLASQLLGFTGTDNDGLAGLELAHDKSLAGRDGKRLLVKDALGEAIKLRDALRTRPGHDLTLTIDSRIQEEAEQVLAEVGEKWKPRKGATAIVMDPRSGELLAVANWPRVNANDVTGAPAWARQNRATGVVYEPGSTFKPFTVSGALEEGLVKPTTSFELGPTIQLYDRTIGEAHDGAYGTLTTAEILQKSSNVGTIKIGLMLGATKFDRWVRRFGFGQTTGVDLAGEEAGILLPLEKYSGASMGNLPIGQGVSVTPMQMAAAYAAIANGGVLRPPHVVKAVGGRATPLPKGKRILTARTSRQVRTMLEGVIGAGGTASGAAIDGYDLAGKTGTAEKPDPINGGYSKTNFVASFAGFAPADNPRLLVTVIVDEPEGDIYGGSVAAPAWRDITSFALGYLKIAPK